MCLFVCLFRCTPAGGQEISSFLTALPPHRAPSSPCSLLTTLPPHRAPSSPHSLLTVLPPHCVMGGARRLGSPPSLESIMGGARRLGSPPLLTALPPHMQPELLEPLSTMGSHASMAYLFDSFFDFNELQINKLISIFQSTTKKKNTQKKIKHKKTTKKKCAADVIR